MSDISKSSNPELIGGLDVPNPLRYEATLKAANALFMFNSVELTSDCEIPEPPFILASAHRGFSDIVALGAVFRQFGRIQFMAKEELFKNKWIGNHLQQCGTFPINREKLKPEQLQRAQQVLSAPNDSILGIFPEGTVQKGSQVENIKSGFGVLALIGQAPVVVTGIAGPEKFPRLVIPTNMHVHASKVITPPQAKSDYEPGESIFRFGVKNRDAVEHLNQETRLAMEEALAKAHDMRIKPSSSIHFINERLQHKVA